MAHRAALAGTEYAIANSFGLAKDIKYHDHLIYAAMIQGGVSQIRCCEGSLPADVARSEFLKSRVILDKDHVCYKTYREINDILQSHLIVNKNDENKQSLTILSFFLADLLYSLDTQSAFVATLPLPDIRDYQGILSPNILSVVGCLLSEIKSVNLHLPLPQFEIESSRVEVFQELLLSDIFALYSESHVALESSEVDEVAAQKNILAKAIEVRKRFVNTIDLKAATLSLIPVTTKLIDTFFGGWPASLANIFGDRLTSLLKKDKKIVIYDYGKSHYDMLMQHYSAIKRTEKI